MRRIATVKNGHPDVKRVMIYASKDFAGVYLFPCASLEDGSGMGDDWYKTLDEADNACSMIYGIEHDDWEIIDDPLEGCLHDWIAPVRVKSREIINKQWKIVLERLENRVWTEIPLPQG